MLSHWPRVHHAERDSAALSDCCLAAYAKLALFLVERELLSLSQACAKQVTETYDWRLAVPLMQKRDNYFTRLKIRVELLHSLHKEKACLTCPYMYRMG